MSIANYSVVGRILTEVQQGPPSPDLVRVERIESPEQVFELRRTECMQRPPFATSFHFWAHSLNAFLSTQRRVDLFEAMATHGLCKVVEGPQTGAALAGLASRVDPRPVLPDASAFRLGYRMLDQGVMASWVAELADEWLAVFWVRPDWLASAAPFDPEEELDPDDRSDRAQRT